MVIYVAAGMTHICLVCAVCQFDLPLSVLLITHHLRPRYLVLYHPGCISARQCHGRNLHRRSRSQWSFHPSLFPYIWMTLWISSAECWLLSINTYTKYVNIFFIISARNTTFSTFVPSSRIRLFWQLIQRAPSWKRKAGKPMSLKGNRKNSLPLSCLFMRRRTRMTSAQYLTQRLQ